MNWLVSSTPAGITRFCFGVGAGFACPATLGLLPKEG